MGDSVFSSTRRPYEHPDHSSYPCDQCGKEYSAAHFLRSHQRSACVSSKRHLTDLLQESKTYWESRKRRRLRYESDEGSETNMLCRSVESQEAEGSTAAIGVVQRSELEAAEMEFGDLDVPVAVRKAKRVPRIPLRYKHNVLPAPPARVTRTTHDPPDGHPAEDMEPTRQSLTPAGAALDTAPEEGSSTSVSPTTAAVPDTGLAPYASSRNVFGVIRRYLLPLSAVPTHDPDQLAVLDDRSQDSTPPSLPASLGPFPSRTAFLLAEWYWQSTKKSFLDFQDLVSIFKDSQFSLNDAIDVNWNAVFKVLGENKSDLPDGSGSWISDDGWRTETVSIDIPFHNLTKEPGIKSYTVGSFRHRSIVSVIKEKLSNHDDSSMFHYYPYEAFWKPKGDSPEVKLYGELYASSAFREAYETLQRQPRTKRDEGLERAVVGLMLWSDATQLTAFGGASLWPCYLFFGNDSKYRRGEPSNNLGQQIAYFMKLPDRLKDYLKEKNGGRVPGGDLLKYCAWQLFHKQWSILLNSEFVDAMKYGTVVTCSDGKRRCFFPRIFTYSCDYPEKSLVCGIRNNGNYPCHRCLAKKGELFKLGGPSDTERFDQPRQHSEQWASVVAAQSIIREGYALSNDRLKSILGKQSVLPLHSAFASSLSEIKPTFDISTALVADILHEFEIGAWKKLFVHLMRILEFLTGANRTGPTLTAELDSRYRCTPSFGRDTIRKFPLNASEMQRRAARDYEDLLQCAIPSFECLLPEEHNTRLMTLLFICAQWHALAKLRLHNDYTLGLLDYTTVQLGAKMRVFNRDTCLKFPTKELKKEAQARARKAAKQNGIGKEVGNAVPGKTQEDARTGAKGKGKNNGKGKGKANGKANGEGDSGLTGDGDGEGSDDKGESESKKEKGKGKNTRKAAGLDVFTIKFHFLGDYTSIIREFGTTDSYSTQTGELYHRMPKSWYPRTDKKDYEPQLSRIERRLARLSLIRAGLNQAIHGDKRKAEGPLRESATAEAEKDAWENVLDCHYAMGRNEDCPVSLNALIDRPEWGVQDPYTTKFIEKLKRHLLPRILEKMGCPNGVPADQWPHVSLRNNRFYSHKILRTNYTTYDVRRDQDVVHIGTSQCNVMLLNGRYTAETRLIEHPYLYGKILGIFHTDVCFVGQLPGGRSGVPQYHRINFVWVNWYQFLGAKEEFSLDRVALLPLSSDGSVNFLDPDNIIRAVHLIPQFSLGEVGYPAPKSKFVVTQKIWKAYYVNRFVDRDMFMRYQYGMSVGHVYMQMDAFPCPQVPTVPRDFDHCAEMVHMHSHRFGRSFPPPSNPTGDKQGEDEEGRGEEEGPRAGFQDGGSSAGERRGANEGRIRDGDQEEVGEGGEEEEEEEEEEDREVRHDEEEDEENEDGEDYLDRMDDQELIDHDDMYGVT